MPRKMHMRGQPASAREAEFFLYFNNLGIVLRPGQVLAGPNRDASSHCGTVRRNRISERRAPSANPKSWRGTF